MAFNIIIGGDHDGTVNGKRYFRCLPNHGMLASIEDVSIVSKIIDWTIIDVS